MVQSIGTDGQLFQFMVFQLNTTDLVSSDGVKNLVWIDSDQNLYEKAQCVPEVKKRVVTVSKRGRNSPEVGSGPGITALSPLPEVWELAGGCGPGFKPAEGS